MGLALSLLTFYNSQAKDYGELYSGLPTSIKPVTEVIIPDNAVRLDHFGAKGDGLTLCTEAFRKAINELTAKGGGRIDIPMGVWLCGPIELDDNIELHLDANAILLISPDKRLFVDSISGGYRCFPAIRAVGKKNIAVTGSGIIDGNGARWRPVKRGKVSDVEWKRFKEQGGTERQDGRLFYPWNDAEGYPNIADTPESQESMRADLIRLTNCENIRLEGVTFQNSPRFHVHPVRCRNVILSGLTVRCPWNAQNGDAIDLSDCHQVLIEGCTVDAGDDGLCLKSGTPAKGSSTNGCEDILIQDNTVYHAHGGFVVGSEFVGGMRHIAVRRCRFSGTDVGLRFKSGIGRGGQSADIHISDIVMTDINGAAISFQCDYVNRPAGSSDAAAQKEVKPVNVPEFTDIHISNVTCRGAKTAIYAHGLQGHNAIHAITIRNSTLTTLLGADIDTATTEIKMEDVRLENYKIH